MPEAEHTALHISERLGYGASRAPMGCRAQYAQLVDHARHGMVQPLWEIFQQQAHLAIRLRRGGRYSSRGSLNTLRNGKQPNPKAKKWLDGEPADEAQQAVRLHLATHGADDIVEEAMRPQEISREEAMREGSAAMETGTAAQASSAPPEWSQASQEAAR